MTALDCMKHAHEELDGAKEYISMAYAMKGTHADWSSKLREMARQETQHAENFYHMSQKAEMEHGDEYAEQVAKYAECRATVKMMIDSM